jgi:putative addiction module component (TIGR02574 family)
MRRARWFDDIGRRERHGVSCGMATLTIEDIKSLSPPERLALIERLWDSMAEPDVPLSAAQRVELESRLASFEEERSRGITWDELKAELIARAP